MEKEKSNKESSLQEDHYQTANDIRKIISDNERDLAFIIGNGINLYFNKKTSWEDLLLHLWNENKERPMKPITEGISFTEFFDILELRRKIKFLKTAKKFEKLFKSFNTFTSNQKTVFNYDKKFLNDDPNTNYNSYFDQFRSGSGSNYKKIMEFYKKFLEDNPNANYNSYFDQLRSGSIYESDNFDFGDYLESHISFRVETKKGIKNIMKHWTGNNKIKIMIDVMQRKNIPLLTTNFDDVLSKSIDAHLQKMQRPQKEKTRFSYYYPWNCYYGNKILESPTLGFGIWHINGMISYYHSIALGLCDYMGCVAKARPMIQGNNISKDENFSGKNRSYWAGYNTWLHIIFNKSLFIFGLSLEENETFLRWLLIQRAKYFALYHTSDTDHHGWYVVGPKDTLNEGKRFFLESVGFKIINIEDYKTIYEDVWK